MSYTTHEFSTAGLSRAYGWVAYFQDWSEETLRERIDAEDRLDDRVDAFDAAERALGQFAEEFHGVYYPLSKSFARKAVRQLLEDLGTPSDPGMYIPPEGSRSTDTYGKMDGRIRIRIKGPIGYPPCSTYKDRALGKANEEAIRERLTDCRVTLDSGGVYIHPTSDDLRTVLEIADSLREYPVLDEGLMSEYEIQETHDYIEDGAIRDYLREHGYDRGSTDRLEDLLLDPHDDTPMEDLSRDVKREIDRACERCGELYLGDSEDVMMEWARESPHSVDESIRSALSDIRYAPGTPEERTGESNRRIFEEICESPCYDTYRVLYAAEECTDYEILEWVRDEISGLLRIDLDEAERLLDGEIVTAPSILIRKCNA